MHQTSQIVQRYLAVLGLCVGVAAQVSYSAAPPSGYEKGDFWPSEPLSALSFIPAPMEILSGISVDLTASLFVKSQAVAVPAISRYIRKIRPGDVLAFTLAPLDPESGYHCLASAPRYLVKRKVYRPYWSSQQKRFFARHNKPLHSVELVVQPISSAAYALWTISDLGHVLQDKNGRALPCRITRLWTWTLPAKYVLVTLTSLTSIREEETAEALIDQPSRKLFPEGF